MSHRVIDPLCFTVLDELGEDDMPGPVRESGH